MVSFFLKSMFKWQIKRKVVIRKYFGQFNVNFHFYV